jgi:N-methylhydantoinase A
MSGFPAVDVRSIGAGGGSIGWLDHAGLLHVGPASAGSVPGPACYGRGGTKPTVTDASLTLGFIDPAYFLGGAMALDSDLARKALERDIGQELGLGTTECATAVLRVVTERMVAAIEDITLRQGIDPSSAVLVGGGGAAGLNIVAIARRLRTALVLVPEVAPSLSAAGALLSDLTRDFSAAFYTTTARFDADGVNRVVAELQRQCDNFASGPGKSALEVVVELYAEGRYPHQVWDLEVPVATKPFSSSGDVDQLRAAFHAAHREIFEISDEASEVEFLSWRARVRCRLRDGAFGLVTNQRQEVIPGRAVREVDFLDGGRAQAPVLHLAHVPPATAIAGPAIVESPWTTIVVDPGAVAHRTAGGTLVIRPWGANEQTPK